jgi:hypothetical protein
MLSLGAVQKEVNNGATRILRMRNYDVFTNLKRPSTHALTFSLNSANLFFKRRSYRNHVLFCEPPRNAEGDKPSGAFR